MDETNSGHPADVDDDEPIETVPREQVPVEGDLHRRTVGDMIRECQTAAQHMSMGNPHRYLLMNCALVMRQLVDRLTALEPKH